MEDNQSNPGEAGKAQPGSRLLAAAVVVSVIFGAFGGVLGALYFAKLPSVQKIFGSTNSGAQFSVQQGVYKEDSAVIEAVKKASPAVVSIIISKDLSKAPGLGQFFGFGFPGLGQPAQNAAPNIQEVGAGSGFFVTSEGLILTNKHVVSDPQASYTVTTTDGKSYPAKVVAQDPVNDLAIIKVDIKDAPTLPLVDSSQAQIGQQVVAIGNSLGEYQNTVTSGIVSGIGRSITAGGNGESEQLEGVIQTDAAINPGNSGGPLLNLAAQVIGINTAVDQQGQSVGFAIASNDAAKALASYQKYGRIVRPFLGIHYVTITPALADQEKLSRDYGALITAGQSSAATRQPAVLPGSPAEKAGLQENDIILAINGHRIDPNNDLVKELKNYSVGDTLSLTVYHNGSEKTVSVTVGEAK